MKKASMGTINPAIDRVVEELLTENSNFDRQENRSVRREYLVRPVNIELRGSDKVVHAFSRNISGAGIGLISNHEFPRGAVAVLEIGRIKGPSLRILAECRWSRSYGGSWFISGWQFISLKR